MTEQQKLLSALVEKPTRYTIDVQNGTMLPEKMQKNKTVDFVIKPPTLETLAKCAIPLQEIPKETIDSEKINLTDALPYVDQMVQVICILSHGKKENYPDWYESFIKNNTTPKEIFQIFQEVSLKMQSDFFLTSFQIANQTNPMMMRTPKNPNGSTPTN